MKTESKQARIKHIDDGLALNEIIDSVRQLSFMKQHCQNLVDLLNVKLEITYGKAPLRKVKKSQTYELNRRSESNPKVAERKLELEIWKCWNAHAAAERKSPFFGEVCQFIQTYQMPLQGTRNDRRWGKIDLVGATPDLLPVVIELKQENASDTPLRMLVEALAYACAVRKAWNEGDLSIEWSKAMERAVIGKNGSKVVAKKILSVVPIVLLAPTDFWDRKIGIEGKRTKGKVKEDAWPIFLQLVHQCKLRGFPIYLVQFKFVPGEAGGYLVSDFASVKLPKTAR